MSGGAESWPMGPAGGTWAAAFVGCSLGQGRKEAGQGLRPARSCPMTLGPAQPRDSPHSWLLRPSEFPPWAHTILSCLQTPARTSPFQNKSQSHPRVRSLAVQGCSPRPGRQVRHFTPQEVPSAAQGAGGTSGSPEACSPLPAHRQPVLGGGDWGGGRWRNFQHGPSWRDS